MTENNLFEGTVIYVIGNVEQKVSYLLNLIFAVIACRFLITNKKKKSSKYDINTNIE
jgi:hypothetical protein